MIAAVPAPGKALGVRPVQRKVTKAGGAWAIVTLEDLAASIEVMVFPQTYALVGPDCVEDAVLLVKGRLDRRDEDAVKLVASEVKVPELRDGRHSAVAVRLESRRCVPETIESLKQILSTHPGTAEVQLQLVNGPRTTVMQLPDHLRVSPSPALYGDLKALLGADCVAAA